MATQDTAAVGCSLGSKLVPGSYYRVTFVSDGGWYDSAQFPARMRQLWDDLASSHMAFPATKLETIESSVTTTVDVKAASGTQNTVAELVRWVEEHTSGGIHVSRLEKLASASAITNATARASASATAASQYQQEQPAQKLGDAAAAAARTARMLVIAIVIVAVCVALVYASKMRSAALG